MRICCTQKFPLSCYQPMAGNPTTELSKLLSYVSSFTFGLFFFKNCLNAKSLFVLYLIENVKKQFTKKQLTYSWSLLSNLRKRTVRIMTNINNTTKVIRTCGVSVIRSRKFPNMALKSIAAGAIKSVFDAKVPKNVLLNFMWFPSALSIF